MTVFIGTSGWQYRDWRGPFYPTDLAQNRWLEHYVAAFRTVEVNATFYRLPDRDVFRSWADRAPAGFVYVVKASRYLTHIRRLREPQEAVARFVERASALGPALGAVLLQLPPDLQADLDRLDGTLAAFPPSWRLAFEPRHPSWWSDETAAVLEARGAAWCLSDRLGTPVGPVRRSASWGYLRLHQGAPGDRPCYERRHLHAWASRLSALFRPGDDVFVFFNNDPQACAVRDAIRFAEVCRSHGLEPTDVPTSRPA